MNFEINITKRKDGRFMGRFIIGYDENRKSYSISTFTEKLMRRRKKADNWKGN